MTRAWRWLIVGVVWLGLYVDPVRAETVAVLDFDGYGVSFDDAALVSQGLRDAFLETRWMPMSDFDIADRLGSGHENDISQARRLVSDARAALDRGSASSALSKLRQAKKLHEASGSPIARRPEMADLYFFMGRALLNLGRRSEAKASLVECLYLYPGYGQHRAPSMGNSLRSLLAEAQRKIDSESKRILSSAEVANLQSRLGVDAVVIGYLQADGTIYARLVEGTTIVNEVKKVSSEVPPFPGEPIYGHLVRELAGLGSGGVSGPAPDYGDPSDAYGPSTYEEDPFSEGSSSGDFEDLPEFDEDDPYAEQPPPRQEGVSIRSPKTDPPPPEHDERESGFRASSEEAGDTRIKSTGRMKYDRGPITHQPWFWGVVVGGLAVGGGVAAIVVLQDQSGGTDDTEDTGSEPDPSSYTLTLETGG